MGFKLMAGAVASCALIGVAVADRNLVVTDILYMHFTDEPK